MIAPMLARLARLEAGGVDLRSHPFGLDQLVLVPATPTELVQT